MKTPLVTVGASALRVPPLALGTWAWGDRGYWGYEPSRDAEGVVGAFVAAVDAGVRLFDTAEVYGHGESERILGWMARRAGVPLALATKFAPLAGRGGVGAVAGALAASLRRLGTRHVALYQVHWADRAEAPIDALMARLAEAVARGLVGAVGVSNFTASEMREAHAALARRGVSLASNQVRYSLLHRAPERDGVLDACRELGVTLLAYSPLEQGALTGRYDPEHLPSGPRAAAPSFAPERLREAARVVAQLRRVGDAHGGRAPEQVALNWLRAKGAIPVVGARNAAQATRNVGALEWSLADDEVEALDALTS